MASQSLVNPGYCIVQQPGTLDFQARLLFNDPNSDAARYFMQVNSDAQWSKPGQMLILDPPGSNNSVQLMQLQLAKKKVNGALADLNSGEANFFNQHFSTIAAVTNFMDKSLGVVADAGEKYFSEIEKKLKSIELAYQNQYRAQGTLISQQFFVERQRLFSELDGLLNKLSRLTLKMKPYNELKHALGLSSRSIVHEWSTAGVASIRGYSTYIDNASKAARFLKAGGWLAIGFAGANTTNEVYNACTVGREQSCSKVAVKKYSSFGASLAGGIYGGKYGAMAGAGVCVALGVATGGVGLLACSIVGAAAGGYVGGEIAGGATEYMMDKIW
ncbi:hypothetical protein V5K00_RS03900 [Enterobacter asburiae]|uniref:Uncharacterized protein n=1 Tax=Enterobacter dykesii TaxID=2797506 RepID=A0AAU7IWM5_9ENTR|nr:MULTISPECIES: hypothetical protein [Enterobacter]KAA0529480.1 hypothetical protein F0321_01400 [Enterobacter asburiae]KAA0530601.1 hypothetical protein F0320_16360 [Enterobacter dykesii]KGI62335.1 membrane protein [Enterobacter sp. UCD-UG_FMILLET]MBG0636590.1 hypothetical protein [Enterobacter asburiae]MCR6467428.1 hypothetical protein [Enterobacter sp. HG048]